MLGTRGKGLGLTKRFRNHTEKQVTSQKNINFPKPYKSDLIIKNNFQPYSQKKIKEIIRKINDIRRDKKKK